MAKRVQAKTNWRMVATQFKEQPQDSIQAAGRPSDGDPASPSKSRPKPLPQGVTSSGNSVILDGGVPASRTDRPDDGVDSLHGYGRRSSLGGAGAETQGEDGPWSPDLTVGHPFLVNQAYLLFRLGKSPQQFDQEWAAEAYQREGGTADAITGYRGLLPGRATAIPPDVAERLGRKYAAAISGSSQRR